MWELDFGEGVTKSKEEVAAPSQGEDIVAL